MTDTLPYSYSTNSVYNTVPEFIQNIDAQNGYPLWWFLYGSCKTLDQINVLTRDNIGPGIHVEADFGAYTGTGINDAQIANPLSTSTDSPDGTTITLFNTDETWNVIDTSVPFPLELVNSLTGQTEYILIPAGHYIWTSPHVTIQNITRGYNDSPVLAWPASAGADGSVYMEDYGGAPGWSQAVDIVRCPDYALPWLAQFVGASIPQDTTLDRQQITQQIEQRAGFDRATSSAIVAELVAITNKQLATGEAPLSPSQVIVMENTQASVSGGNNYYTYNQYALTLLVPSGYFSSYTYQSLQAASGGNSATYTSTDSFIASIGGLYFSLAGSTTPSSESPYVNFVYRYRPAGMQIFVGGY